MGGVTRIGAFGARITAGGLLCLLYLLGTGTGWAQSDPELEQKARTFVQDYDRPEAIPYPEDNAYSSNRYTLGKKLFFDPRLSNSQIVSCATCHNPSFAWQDGLPLGVGHGMKQMGRRTPTLLNLAWGGPYLWDGRADTLEQQALGPIASTAVMSLPLDQMLSRLQSIAGYAQLFEAAYPGEGITRETVAKAIANFERSIVSGEAPFDRWATGDTLAMNDSAKRGFVLFNTKARCAQCHTGWRFTNDSFHDIGLDDDDVGRGKFVKIVKAMQFAFKTPTLRNVAQRAPYMHNGSITTLESVVAHYDRGGAVQRASLSREMQPLSLTDGEQADLVEFMKALSSNDRWVTLPTLPQ